MFILGEMGLLSQEARVPFRHSVDLKAKPRRIAPTGSNFLSSG